MTTIAYRSGTLAADTGVCRGNQRVGRKVKIARHSDGRLAGAAGRATYSEAFLSWFCSGEGGPPEAKCDNESCDRGVVFEADGWIHIYEDGGKYSYCPGEVPYFAMGSGGPEALGAMFAGADAQTAIRAAMEHDAHTYGDVTWLTHDAAKLAVFKEAAE